METSLLRQPTRQLELLTWSKQLKKVRFNDYSAVRFLSNAIFSLRGAQSPSRAASGRYFIAHDGIYSLCLGIMYLHGLLPVGKEGQKELVVRLGFDMLLMPATERDLVLTSRKLLATATTEAIDSIEDRDVRWLSRIADQAVSHAGKIFPDWFS